MLREAKADDMLLHATPTTRREMVVTADGVELPGVVRSPADPVAAVVFAHATGGDLGRLNARVASVLHGAGMATFLCDLLTPDEAKDRRNVFDLSLLAQRLAAATALLATDAETGPLPVGCFAAGTGAAAALWAAAGGAKVQAIVSHDGRPDLAREQLHRVGAPTLLIVGGYDMASLELNEEARTHMRCDCELRLVPGVAHLFDGQRVLDVVARLARDWFLTNLWREPSWP